jgi:hypothetical protein
MGLDSSSVKFICSAKLIGVDYTNTLTIGRQSMLLSPESLKRVFSVLNIKQDASEFLLKNHYGEALFSLMGAQTVHSIDYSSYEGSTYVHDMNNPIPDEYRKQYSVVYDGGTLEHVFNITQALKNCMEMVRVGGHFIQVNIANNFMGHGFWQFSPELIFNIFSEENGFKIVTVLLHEVIPEGGWYIVTNPNIIQSRVELCNSMPTYILTIARRIADTKIFSQNPQQSDYVTAWEQSNNTEDKGAGSWIKKWRSYIPDGIKRRLHKYRTRREWTYNIVKQSRQPFKRPYYKKISENDLLHGRLS